VLVSDTHDPGQNPGMTTQHQPAAWAGHQVVGGRDKGEHPADTLDATVAGFAQAAERPHPIEHLLDTLATAPAGRVAGMARGAAINDRTALVVLRDVWCHA